ncbi:MAG: VOC family protein [Sandaracinaceae bacterium]|jgi:2,3-dihydroxybiphenyl 1,2-dioxygenase|nr:VOC family protein [Sandaracinaceae bacterium]
MSLIQQLGFLEFEVSDLGAWEVFMTKVLGTQLVDKATDGSMRFRMDGHGYRFVVTPGPRDDLKTMGWQVADAVKLDECVARLTAAGVEVTRGSAEACADRGVAGMALFRDPGRIPVELFYGPTLGKEPFKSEFVGSHFVADELGLGHLVISTRNRDESRDFYMNVLGFKLSDHIVCDIGTYHVDIAFLHTNPRHHSLAMGGPMPKRVHHFMLQVASIDDVGLAYDRARDHDVVIEQELGRHPNDRMFSFYAQTPSGTQFEFGHGGRIIDDETWEPTTYNAISEWGHRRPPRKRPKTETPA